MDVGKSETRALACELTPRINVPTMPRIRVLRDILAKFGEMGPQPPTTNGIMRDLIISVLSAS
jgi:hypothetical protein